jgi:membrane protease subunit (stomatin/prohibitin family)
MIEMGILSKINKNWLSLILPNIFNKRVMRESNTKYTVVNKIGKEVLNELNINNISYLTDTKDEILKKYYNEFIVKIREYLGGSIQLKSFNINKLKYNKKLYDIVKKNNKYNILNIIDRIYVKKDNNIVTEIFGRTYNKIYYKLL